MKPTSVVTGRVQDQPSSSTKEPENLQNGDAKVVPSSQSKANPTRLNRIVSDTVDSNGVVMRAPAASSIASNR